MQDGDAPLTTRLTVANDLGALDGIVAWTAAFLEPRADGEALAGRLHLVIEELVVNVIDHGYPPGTDGKIRLTLTQDRGGVTLTVEDDAPPFDPLGDAPPESIDAALEDRPIGGLGVFLVRELSDDVRYAFEDGHNRLFVRFDGTGAADTPPPQEPEAEAVDEARGSRLTTRFVALFVAVFLIGLGCAGVLNFLKFERAYLDASMRRYDATLTEAHRTIEKSLGPGLSLASSFSTQTIIDKLAAQHDQTFHLAVYDPEGAELFSLQSWRPFAEYSHEALWPLLIDEKIVHFGDVPNLGAVTAVHQGGRRVGAIVLTHGGEGVTRETGRLAAALWRVGLLVAAIGGPLMAISAYLVILPMERRHLRLARAVEALDAPGTRSDLAVRDDDFGIVARSGAIHASLTAAGAGETRTAARS